MQVSFADDPEGLLSAGGSDASDASESNENGGDSTWAPPLPPPPVDARINSE